MSELDSKALKACPFCGSPAKLIKDYFGYYSSHNGQESFRVRCDGIECLNPKTLLYLDEDNAIAAWNRRALPAPATQEVDELRGAPLPLRNDTEGYWELVTRDVATITDLGRGALVEPILRMDNREVIGFRVWDSRLSAEEDTARLDWLEMQSVKVPSNFWAFPPGGGTARPSDLRAQIDRARLAEVNKNG